MWKVVEGKRKSEYCSKWESNTKWLERDDGTIMVRYGISREKEENFFLQKGDFRCDFQARRWDLETKSPTDIYIVTIMLLQCKKEAIPTHAKDIESGLLVYPLHSYWENIPAKQVLFRISPILKPWQLVRAEDMTQ